MVCANYIYLRWLMGKEGVAYTGLPFPGTGCPVSMGYCFWNCPSPKDNPRMNFLKKKAKNPQTTPPPPPPPQEKQQQPRIGLVTMDLFISYLQLFSFIAVFEAVDEPLASCVGVPF